VKPIFNSTNVINLIAGLLVGFYPFITWKLIIKYLFRSGKPVIIAGFILLKLVIIGLILYLLNKATFFRLIPFTVGLITAPMAIIFGVLATGKKK